MENLTTRPADILANSLQDSGEGDSMNYQNDEILKELIDLDKKAQVTGRKCYKRISELQFLMLQNSLNDCRTATANADELITQNISRTLLSRFDIYEKR